MYRRQQREQAFLFIFEHEFHKNGLDEIINLKKKINGENYQVSKFAKKLFKGIQKNKEEIDELIEKNLVNWSKDRISKVAISILRIAVYELKFEESTPYSVSINEAVELAKKYGESTDASFVNGILGSIVVSIES